MRREERWYGASAVCELMRILRTMCCHVAAALLAPAAAIWSRMRERRILREGRPLADGLAGFAREIGIREPEGIRVDTVDRVPLPLPGFLVPWARRLGIPVFEPAGMALGRGIAAISEEPALLRHELVHVLQYQRLGGHLAFMRLYLFECLCHGYFAAPLEAEARGGALPRDAV